MSYLFKSLAAGAAGALVVVFVKDAIIERKTLQRLKAELVLNETELRQLEKNIFDSKKTVLELEEEQRSAGSALSQLEKELSRARAVVKRLEAEQTSRNVQLATTQGLLSTKGALLSDLVRLQQVKQGKVSELTTTVENQVAKIAEADHAANPLNHPLVKGFFK